MKFSFNSEVAVTYLRAPISPSTPATTSTLNRSPFHLHANASPRPASSNSNSNNSSSSSLPPGVWTWAAHPPTASAPPAPRTTEATERITGTTSTLRSAWGDPPPAGPKRGRAPRSSACAWTPGWHKAVLSWPPVSHTQGWAGERERGETAGRVIIVIILLLLFNVISLFCK